MGPGHQCSLKLLISKKSQGLSRPSSGYDSTAGVTGLILGRKTKILHAP